MIVMYVLLMLFFDVVNSVDVVNVYNSDVVNPVVSVDVDVTDVVFEWSMHKTQFSLKRIYKIHKMSETESLLEECQIKKSNIHQNVT